MGKQFFAIAGLALFSQFAVAHDTKCEIAMEKIATVSNINWSTMESAKSIKPFPGGTLIFTPALTSNHLRITSASGEILAVVEDANQFWGIISENNNELILVRTVPMDAENKQANLAFLVTDLKSAAETVVPIRKRGTFQLGEKLISYDRISGLYRQFQRRNGPFPKASDDQNYRPRRSFDPLNRDDYYQSTTRGNEYGSGMFQRSTLERPSGP